MRASVVITIVLLSMQPKLARSEAKSELKEAIANGARAMQAGLLVARENCPLYISPRAWQQVHEQGLQGGIDLSEVSERERATAEADALYKKITNLRTFCEDMRPMLAAYPRN